MPSAETKPARLTYSGQGARDPKAPSLYDGGLLPRSDHPSGYIADPDLVDAVNTAILLGQPLLLMGEPGTGKTQLAHSMAWEFGLPLYDFNTKMNSAGTDVFYRYNALLHFHDTHTLGIKAKPSKYVEYGALGRAILASNEPSTVAKYLEENRLALHEKETKSVVLIDEVDKASRDFPNDILAEIEQLKFPVPEAGWEIQADQNRKPILVITSNQERNLPEAFLRRCIFYYIKFPDANELGKIVKRRLEADHSDKIEHFLDIRKDERLLKKPATAELLSWLRVLQDRGIKISDLKSATKEARRTYGVLLKNKEDFERYARPS